MPLVVLDPGHGGDADSDRGFVGTGYEQNEGRNNYLTCVLIKKHLEDNYDVTVKMTRNSISDNPWPGRGGMFPNADLFYSRHSNAFDGSGSVRGTEVWVKTAPGNTRALATDICAKLSAFFGHTNRGVKTGSYQVVSEAEAAGAKMAMLAEIGFHDNATDAGILVNKRQEIAILEAETIANHLNLSAGTPTVGQDSSNLTVGAKIKFGKYRVGTEGYQPIIWKVAAKNHPGYPAGSLTLIAEDILDLRAFDGREPGNANSSRRTGGNNRYGYSNLDQWLNDTASSAWYTARHSNDQPPSASYVDFIGTAYDTKAGFLNAFSTAERGAILSTSIKVVKPAVDGGGSETLSRKVFLPSVTEVGLTDEGVAEGSRYALFATASERVAHLTTSAYNYTGSTEKPSSSGASWTWWLRTPSAAYAQNAKAVDTDGTVWSFNADSGRHGVRPVINISASIGLTGTLDSDGCFNVVWGNAPTSPSSLNVPTAVSSGSTVSISWGASTDADNDLSGYQLERAVDGGTFTQIYKGSSRSYSDAVPAGSTSVQYRVRAYDSTGLYSAYSTSAVRTVTSNSLPVISGTNTNLGTKTAGFTHSYTVTDADSTTLTVSEYIDGKLIRRQSLASGESTEADITGLTWLKLLNGSHTLKIVAVDSSNGSSERSILFTKSVTSFTIDHNALPSTTMPTRVLLKLQGEIPSGAGVEVLVSNNGLDTTPTWEDASEEVANGLVHMFTNTVKTDANWGVRVKVTGTRSGATGAFYITSIGGNFE